MYRERLDGIFCCDSRNTGVDWRLGFNLAADKQMLGFAPHGSKGVFIRVMVSSVVSGYSLPVHSCGGRKSVMHIPQRLCFQTVHAGAKKKQDHFSETEESDTVSMKEWALSKPAGFGENNVYDTSLEEGLLEEFKRDRAAQAAALLKRERKAQGKVEQKKTKEKAEFEPQPGVVEVWVGNLPKKKNIERDLRLAFKNVSGLLHINPAVLGNEKTRDPICKGFGSLFFQNTSSAKSFISLFEDESVLFGNIQKKLSYKILKDSGSASDVPLFIHGKNSINVPKLRVRDKIAALNVSFESIPTSRTDLQPDSISPSMFDTESPEDGKAKAHASAETWNGDDNDVDIELAQKRKGLCNALKTHAETTVTKIASDTDYGDVCDGSNGEAQRDFCINVVDSLQREHLHHVSTDSGDFLYESRTDFSRGDQNMNLITNNASPPQENSVNTLLVADVKKRESQKGPLSEDEKRIEALEKRLLNKIKGAEVESKEKGAGVESKEKDSKQQQKKERGLKSIKSKPSKWTLGSGLGSASRLKKKERKFITDTLVKYGRKESITNS